jgi:hypothetical protein
MSNATAVVFYFQALEDGATGETPERLEVAILLLRRVGHCLSSSAFVEALSAIRCVWRGWRVLVER